MSGDAFDPVTPGDVLDLVTFRWVDQPRVRVRDEQPAPNQRVHEHRWVLAAEQTPAQIALRCDACHGLATTQFRQGRLRVAWQVEHGTPVVEHSLDALPPCTRTEERPVSVRRIRVTAEHIARGEPRHPGGCPIAVALQDAGLPAIVGERSADLAFGSSAYRSALPHTARQFIERFDLGAPVHPFEFDIEVPA